MNYWTKKFKELNKKYWGGKLSNIRVYVRDFNSNYDALYHYPDGGRKAKIVLDKQLGHYEKKNVLLHEMCHHAVEELYDERPYHDHGTEWKEEMRRCGFIGKIHRSRGRYKTKAG